MHLPVLACTAMSWLLQLSTGALSFSHVEHLAHLPHTYLAHTTSMTVMHMRATDMCAHDAASIGAVVEHLHEHVLHACMRLHACMSDCRVPVLFQLTWGPTQLSP